MRGRMALASASPSWRLACSRRIWPNTTDFRCLWFPGVLWFSCSVRALESVFVMAGAGRGHGCDPRVAAGWRAVPRSAAPAGGAVPPSWRFRSWRLAMRSRARTG